MHRAILWVQGQSEFQIDGDGVLVTMPTGEVSIRLRMSRSVARAGAERLLRLIDDADIADETRVFEFRRRAEH